MIERHVYVRLNEGSRDESTVRNLLDSVRQLAELAPVEHLRTFVPADDGAAAAWDLCLVVTFADLAAFEIYRDHPVHREFAEQLKPRLQVLKAWNLRSPVAP